MSYRIMICISYRLIPAPIEIAIYRTTVSPLVDTPRDMYTRTMYIDRLAEDRTESKFPVTL
jgi:hypothetical protein